MTNSKATLLWIISILIMGFVVIFQKTTGPTYPQKGDKEIYGQNIEYSLPRSNDGAHTIKVGIDIGNSGLNGYVNMKRFKSHDKWSKIDLTKNGNQLSFEIPNQPAAGKVIYHVYLTKDNKEYIPLTEQPVIARFRDFVPMWVIVFHLIFIFSSITLSIRTGFEAFFRGTHSKILSILTLITLIFGGFVFGPLMQEYAFGAFWTGWPFGHDLTDNKTAVALIFWLIALWSSYKKPEKRVWHITAAIVLMVVYLIPHSILGSEIDYTKEENQSIENTIGN